MKYPSKSHPLFYCVSVLLLALFPSFSEAAWSPARSGRVDGERPYTYTVIEDLSSPNPDVVYVLHGGHSNDEELSVWATTLGQEWSKLNYAPPRLVSISFGDLWMLVNRNESPESGLLPIFLNDVIPKAETEWLTSKKMGRRQVLGFSMGGMNALLLAMAAPEKFEKFVALAPSLYAISPLAEKKEIALFSEKHGIPLESKNGPIVGSFLNMIRAVIPSESAWAEIDPAYQFSVACERLLKVGLAARPILVSTGDQDIMFFSPSREVADLAKRAGFLVTWVPAIGVDHEVKDTGLIARFLME